MSVRDQSVRLDIDDGIGTITLNRPHRLNAFDADAARAWREVTARAVSDDSVRVILLRAEGRAFSAGGDVRAMAEGGEALGDGVGALAAVLNEGIVSLMHSSVPVVAAAQGTTVGGGLGILLASDYAVVADDSRIGSLYADMGLTPDLSVTAQLARAVGERRALQLVLTSRLLDAREALEWGLVAEVVAPDQVQARAVEVARSIADCAAWAYGQAKRLIRSQPARGLDDQLAEEARTIAAAVATTDAQVRISAFAGSGRS